MQFKSEKSRYKNKDTKKLHTLINTEGKMEKQMQTHYLIGFKDLLFHITFPCFLSSLAK